MAVTITYNPIGIDGTWHAGSNCSVTTETGTYSPLMTKIEIGGAAGTNQIAAYADRAAIDISDKTHVKMWVKSTINLVAGDLEFRIAETADLTSPVETLDFPALTANTWTEVILELAGDTDTRDAVQSIGVYQVVDNGNFFFYIDCVFGCLALSTYTLQTSLLGCGTLTIYLDSSIHDLTIPSCNTLLVSTEITQKIDTVPGESEMPKADFEYMEDYSTYTEGFWYKVLNGSIVNLRLDLLEPTNANVHTVFYGTLAEVSPVIEEVSLQTGYFIRKGMFTCVSMLYLMEQSTPLETTTDIWDNERYTVLNSQPDWPVAGALELFYVRVTEFIASMMFVSGMNNSYSASDVSYQNANEFQYDTHEPGAAGTETEKPMTNLAILAGYDNGALIQYGALYDWPGTYATNRALLVAICRSLGVIPYHYYDYATSRHKIILLVRGSSGDTVTMYGGILKSTFYPHHDSILSKAIVTPEGNPDDSWWVMDGTFGAVALPGEVDPDYGQTIIFGSDLVTGAPTDTQLLFIEHASNGKLYFVEFVRYYNYNTSSMWYGSATSARALVGYLWDRFRPVPIKRGYERVYSSIAVTTGGTTHTGHVKPTIVVSINDGVVSKNFYAVEIRRDLFKNEMTIKWNEV